MVLSLTMFCQKSPGHLDLAALVDTSGIQHVSVHATCSLVPSISSIDRRMHILWSRVGLEEVVDGRGCLYLCLYLYLLISVPTTRAIWMAGHWMWCVVGKSPAEA